MFQAKRFKNLNCNYPLNYGNVTHLADLHETFGTVAI